MRLRPITFGLLSRLSYNRGFPTLARLALEQSTEQVFDLLRRYGAAVMSTAELHDRRIETARDVPALKIDLSIDQERALTVLRAAVAGGDAPIVVQADPLYGLHDYQVTAVANGLEIPRSSWQPLAALMQAVYRAFVTADLLSLHLEPVIYTEAGIWYVGSARSIFDGAALFRHPEVANAISEPSIGPRSLKALGITYIKLGGQIACIANGAGLAMAAMDAVTRLGVPYNITPASFVDIGGSARSETVRTALGVVLEDAAVLSIILNVFGGLTRPDDVAQGLIGAYSSSMRTVPVVIRLHGSAAQAGSTLIQAAGLDSLVTFADSLDNAASRALTAARGG